MKIQGHAALLLAGVATLAVSGVVSMLHRPPIRQVGFGESSVAPASPIETGVERVAAARQFVAMRQVWEPKEIGAKRVSLLGPSRVLQLGSRYIDAASGAAQPELGGVSPAFLERFGLPLRHAVGALDPDGDGFTNREEFAGETDPTDPLDHPPFYTKIVFRERASERYVLQFAADIAGVQFQITRTEPERASGIFSVGDSFFQKDRIEGESGRFTIDAHRVRQAVDPVTGQLRKVAQLDITDARLNEKFTLDLRQPVFVKNLSAVVGLDIPGYGWVASLKVGDVFALPPEPAAFYRVLEILDDRLLIHPVEEPSTVIECWRKPTSER